MTIRGVRPYPGHTDWCDQMGRECHCLMSTALMCPYHDPLLPTPSVSNLFLQHQHVHNSSQLDLDNMTKLISENSEFLEYEQCLKTAP